MNNNDLVSIGTAKVGAIKGVADSATTAFAGHTAVPEPTIASSVLALGSVAMARRSRRRSAR